MNAGGLAHSEVEDLMRALVYHGPGDTGAENRPDPGLGPGASPWWTGSQLARSAMPGDLAGPGVLLASNEALYVTGAALLVYGGLLVNLH